MEEPLGDHVALLALLVAGDQIGLLASLAEFNLLAGELVYVETVGHLLFAVAFLRFKLATATVICRSRRVVSALVLHDCNSVWTSCPSTSVRLSCALIERLIRVHAAS